MGRVDPKMFRGKEHCPSCIRFHMGTKQNESGVIGKAMFCKRSETHGKFIWWGHRWTQSPAWCTGHIPNNDPKVLSKLVVVGDNVGDKGGRWKV